MLAGSVLGARRGALAVLVFLVLVAAGMPWLAGGRGGLGVFAGPSAGFLLGWLPGAAVVGTLVARRPATGRRRLLAWLLLANVVGGIAVVYALGVPVLAWRGDLSLAAAAAGSAVYLPGDLVKVGDLGCGHRRDAARLPGHRARTTVRGRVAAGLAFLA